MAAKLKKKIEYSFLSLLVTDFNIRSSVCVNPEARDNRYSAPETKIYEQNSTIDIQCSNIDPDEPLKDTYHFSLLGFPASHMNPDLALANYHVEDNRGFKKYRKLNDREVPVYDIPKGMNVIDKKRGERHWSSALWLTPAIVSDIIVLLLSGKDIYVACHVRCEDRVAWLNGFNLQTENPLDC
jgi:hypothetical protein